MQQTSDPRFQIISCANCGSEKNDHINLLESEVIHPGHLNGAALQVVTCGQCGLVFLNPQPTRAALGQFYEREYYQDKKVSVTTQNQQTQWQKEMLFTWLSAQLPPINNWRILDIGCGYGEWLRHFDHSNRASGIELSKQAAEAATKQFGFEVRQCAFEDNGFPEGQFDLVTGLAIIEHFTDPLAALVEVNRLLKPGGYLYLRTPDVLGPVTRGGIRRYFKLVHTYYYSAATLESLCRKAGLDVIATRRRPPVLSTSDFLRPNNFWEGELDIVARKRESVSLAQARSTRGAGDNPQEVIQTVQRSITRDASFARLHNLYRIPVLGRLCNFIVRACYLITGRDTKKRDRRAEQMRVLKNGL